MILGTHYDSLKKKNCNNKGHDVIIKIYKCGKQILELILFKLFIHGKCQCYEISCKGFELW
jgi:hypothetical protein